MSSVTSLANIIEIGTIMPLGEVTVDPGRLSELKSYVYSADLYRGKVVSEDGSASVIVSHMNPRYNRIAVAGELMSRTRAAKGDHTVHFSGYPVQMAKVSF